MRWAGGRLALGFVILFFPPPHPMKLITGLLTASAVD